MIIFSYDLETTGLDFFKDRPIEVGAVLYSTTQSKCLESQGFLVKSDVPVSQEITGITGITQKAVDKFGYDTDAALEIVHDMMKQADAVIGHNVVRFDKRMHEQWQNRENLHTVDKLWVDTFTDLTEFDLQGRKTVFTKLSYMAADKGILNLFPHSAMSDCQTVIKLVEFYDIEKVVERAKSPQVVVQAHQRRDQNDLAKKAKFRWYPDRKIWWKFCKEMDLEEFSKTVEFDISVHRENIEEFKDL